MTPSVHHQNQNLMKSKAIYFKETFKLLEGELEMPGLFHRGPTASFHIVLTAALVSQTLEFWQISSSVALLECDFEKLFCCCSSSEH